MSLAPRSRSAGQGIHNIHQVRLPPIDWYHVFFDARAQEPGSLVTGEATPLYHFHPDVAKRIHDAGLNPKFLVILRCPIDRAGRIIDTKSKRVAKIAPSPRCLPRKLIHTATRTSEVLEARWDRFDIDKALWTIPALRMKAKKKNRVPFTPRAIAILKSIPQQSDLALLGAKAGRPLFNMAMTQLMRRMDLGHRAVAGFRPSFPDWACSPE